MTPNVPPEIRTQIERMRAIARSGSCALRDERVSAWSVAEQLDHTYKVAMSIVRRLADEHAEPSPKPLSFDGKVILLLGWIPRGRGKTPERLSGKECSAEDIERSLDKLERETNALTEAALIPSRGRVVPHPRFGGLTPPQALRFLVVHTRHHLKIVEEILRAAERQTTLSSRA